jgi:nucleoside-diphosphate-sugar epimerase
MSTNSQIDNADYIAGPDEVLLVTGAGGFIGSRVVKALLNRGFRNIRCFARPASRRTKIALLTSLSGNGAKVEVCEGNLLSPDDCARATKDVSIIFHLAAARGEKSVPDAYMNSVVTTRNLVEAGGKSGVLKRFVNISSFSVYSNRDKRRWRLLDESCPVEAHPETRGDAYCFAKTKQDEIVGEYARKYGISHVIIRPGYVYGPGNTGITGRVGIGTFGLFLHLGGSNPIPFTYVDNCADAIALAGVHKASQDGDVFNVVDDDVPTSRRFLRLYKRNVKSFRSVYVPHFLSYLLCYLWESYSVWSEGQMEPVFNSKSWHAYWKKTHYSNEKLKNKLGWKPKVSMNDGLKLYFESCQGGRPNA